MQVALGGRAAAKAIATTRKPASGEPEVAETEPKPAEKTSVPKRSGPEYTYTKFRNLLNSPAKLQELGINPDSADVSQAKEILDRLRTK